MVKEAFDGSSDIDPGDDKINSAERVTFNPPSRSSASQPIEKYRAICRRPPAL